MDKIIMIITCGMAFALSTFLVFFAGGIAVLVVIKLFDIFDIW